MDYKNSCELKKWLLKTLVDVSAEIREESLYHNNADIAELLEVKQAIDGFLRKLETKKPKGYNGFFPSKSVMKFHNESFGIQNGIASINVYIEDGKYKGFDISVIKKGVINE